MIITYHKRKKQNGQRGSRCRTSRAKDDIPYDRTHPYEQLYGVPPPPDQLFPPRDFTSWIRRPERPETHLEGRTLASGVRLEDGLARRREGSSSSDTRALQHHHHCHRHHHCHHHHHHVLIIVKSRTLGDHLMCYLNNSSIYAITLV